MTPRPFRRSLPLRIRPTHLTIHADDAVVGILSRDPGRKNPWRLVCTRCSRTTWHQRGAQALTDLAKHWTRDHAAAELDGMASTG
jgi:hypothetical protein